MAQQIGDGSGTAASADRVPVSAEQIRTRRFRETPVGRRGYRPDEVDNFLERVANEVEQLTAANADAHAEIDRLRNWFRNHGERPDANRHDADTDPIHILDTARQHADQVVRQVQQDARSRYFDVRRDAGAIVSQARRAAEHAARAYRAQAGPGHSHDREQAERPATLAHSLLALVSDAITALDGAAAQVHIIWHALDDELRRLSGNPAGRPAVGRASPTGPAPERDQR
jgi:DivIVA domain-containing protein